MTHSLSSGNIIFHNYEEKDINELIIDSYVHPDEMIIFDQVTPDLHNISEKNVSSELISNSQLQINQSQVINQTLMQRFGQLRSTTEKMTAQAKLDINYLRVYSGIFQNHIMEIMQTLMSQKCHSRSQTSHLFPIHPKMPYYFINNNFSLSSEMFHPHNMSLSSQ